MMEEPIVETGDERSTMEEPIVGNESCPMEEPIFENETNQDSLECESVEKKHVPFKVRENLQPYFEVINYETCELICNLSGETKKCKYDGEKGTLKYVSRNGWKSFQRHLIGVHGISKDDLDKNKPEREKKPYYHPTVRIKEVKSSREKYCVVCCEQVQNNNNLNTSELVGNASFVKEMYGSFPGSGGSAEFSHHLFSVFFLRNMLEFPSTRCATFLRSCKGLRMPGTWFFLCEACKEVVHEAAELHVKILALQESFNSLKHSVKAKIYDTINLSDAINLSEIENDIRMHVILPMNLEEDRCKENVPENEDSSYEIDDSPSAVDDPLENDDTDWVPTISHVDSQGESTSHYASRRSRRQTLNVKYETDFIEPDLDYDVDYDNQMATETELDDDYEINDNDMELADYVSDDSDFIPPVTSKKRFKSSSDSKQKKWKATSGPRKRSNKPPRRSEPSADRTEKVDKEPQIHVCDLCPARYKNTKHFRDHQGAHEISKANNHINDCPHCGFPCPSDKAKEIHISNKHDRKGYPCLLCNYVAVRRKDMRVHLRQHKESSKNERVGDKFVCNICNELFISYVMLCKHKRSAHYKEMGVVPLKCDHCFSIFSSKKHLKDHIQQTHKKESKYYCELCGKGMLYLSKLRRHMKSHAPEKTSICEICGADFNYEETMKSHMKKEHPAGVLTLQTGAPQSEAGSSATEVKHVCKHCGLELASISCLVRHIRTHKEVYKHKCDLCGKDYATPQSLRRHKDINHTESTSACPFCSKTFPHKEYVRAHYKFCKRYPGRTNIPEETMDSGSKDQNTEESSSLSEAYQSLLKESSDSDQKVDLITCDGLEGRSSANVIPASGTMSISETITHAQKQHNESIAKLEQTSPGVVTIIKRTQELEEGCFLIPTTTTISIVVPTQTYQPSVTSQEWR